MVSKSPKIRLCCSPSKWPFTPWHIHGGPILTTYKSWDDPPSIHSLKLTYRCNTGVGSNEFPFWDAILFRCEVRTVSFREGYVTNHFQSPGMYPKTIPNSISINLHSTARLFDPAHRTGKRLVWAAVSPNVWVESTTVWQGNLAKVQIIFIICIKERNDGFVFLNQQIEDAPIHS